MSNSSTAKDLTAGTVGGIAQVLVGQPFDIVKVVRPFLCCLFVSSFLRFFLPSPLSGGGFSFHFF